MAKLRVECIVGGWAPGVRTITSSVLFHSMTGFTDCEAESARSSLLVTVMLANPVTGLKRPAHRTANAKILFTIRFTAPIGFSERCQALAGPRTCRGPWNPTLWKLRGGEIYSNTERDSTG